MLYYLDEFDDLWQMDNNKVVELAHSEAKRIGLFSKKDVKKVYVNRFPNAICSYSGTYFDVAPVREFLKEFNNLYLLGSNANHKIMPIDEAMFCGINVAREIDRNYYEQ